MLNMWAVPMPECDEGDPVSVCDEQKAKKKQISNQLLSPAAVYALQQQTAQ